MRSSKRANISSLSLLRSDLFPCVFMKEESYFFKEK